MCLSGKLLSLTAKSLFEAELFIEPLNTSTGIYQLLLAGIEGMALGAHLDPDVFLGGTGFDDLTADAANGGLFVLGMDAFFQLSSPLS